jgi:hypothetical protein
MHSFVRLLRSALISLSAGGRGSFGIRRRAAGRGPLPPVAVPPVPPAAAPAPDPKASIEDAEPPLPSLRLPDIPSPRLELPDLEPVEVSVGARPLDVAAFVAAELRSIPARWIEEASGRGGAAVAVAVAPAPLARPAFPARVRLLPALPEPEPEVEDPAAEEAPSDWPLAPAAIIRPCPLPDGAMLFGPLRSSYVDGPSLLRDLGRRGHSGALVTAGEGRAQAALLHRGCVLGLVAAGRSGTRRLERLRLPAAGQTPEHDLTVPVYRPEVALALAQLVNLPGRHRRLHASFVRLPALLEHLAETRVTGGLRVITGADVGVLLFSDGDILGGYSARHPALEEPEVVIGLCTGDAEIDVHAAPLASEPAAVEVGRLLG